MPKRLAQVWRTRSGSCWETGHVAADAPCWVDAEPVHPSFADLPRLATPVLHCSAAGANEARCLVAATAAAAVVVAAETQTTDSAEAHIGVRKDGASIDRGERIDSELAEAVLRTRPVAVEE